MTLPTKETKTLTQVSLHLTDSQKEQLDALAQLKGKQTGAMVRDLCVEAIARNLSAITEYQQLRESLR